MKKYFLLCFKNAMFTNLNLHDFISLNRSPLAESLMTNLSNQLKFFFHGRNVSDYLFLFLSMLKRYLYLGKHWSNLFKLIFNNHIISYDQSSFDFCEDGLNQIPAVN